MKTGLNSFQWLQWLAATIVAAFIMGGTLVVFAIDKFETRDHSNEIRSQFKDDLTEIKAMLTKLSDKVDNIKK
jgi:molybdopterin/thiamine biosynthesis adenylyltransferase